MASLTTYRAKRKLTLTISTIAIIVLPFLNVLRLDIPTLRFYFLNTVLWVDEFYLLFLVMMLVLSIIVFFSMVYGRAWCGWMCPQTTLNEIIHWLEKTVRRRLRVPKKFRRLTWRLIATHSIIALAAFGLSLIVGFNLVAYFVDPYRMLSEMASLQLGPVTGGFIIGLAVLVFIDVMFWRERFCTKVCSYGMMQFLVTDASSQIVRYQTERDHECIDCKACVRDCMMGIDIRTSPYQMECIHCGDCVDSCTDILSQLGAPTLISFNWGEKESGEKWYEKIGLIDGKRRFILGIIVAFGVVLAAVSHNRQPVALSAFGDRSTLYRQEEDGCIFNDYSLRISNRSLEDRTFLLECSSADPTGDRFQLHLHENPIALKSREAQTLEMSICTKGKNLRPGPNRLLLSVTDSQDSGVRTVTEIVFFMPENSAAKLSPATRASQEVLVSVEHTRRDSHD